MFHDYLSNSNLPFKIVIFDHFKRKVKDPAAQPAHFLTFSLPLPAFKKAFHCWYIGW